jgi:hypothetical protein
MAYLDGELSAERSVSVANHLDTCEECRRHVSDFQDLSRQLSTWHVDPIHSDAPRLPEKRRFTFRLWRTAALAAGTIAVAATLIFLQQRSQQRIKSFRSTDPSVSMQSESLAADSEIKIAKTAQLSITSSHFELVRSAVERITQSNEGYVGELQLTSTAGQPRTFAATLHIPAARLDSALTQLKHLGRVDTESQSGEDVTQRHVDLDARLVNLRATEQRLRQMLQDRTGRLSDVLEVELALDKTRGEIDTAIAEQRALSSRIEYATVRISVSEEAAPAFRLLSPGATLLMLILVGYFPARWLWRKRPR